MAAPIAPQPPPPGAVLDNRAIAQVFHSIALLLEAKGELPFKTRAYARAAAAFEALDTPLSDLAAQGRLRSVPGVGVAIAQKVQELLATGQLAFYQRLTAEVPESLLAVMALPGVTPRLAGRLWRELGITQPQDLRASAAEGRLDHAPRLAAQLHRAVAHLAGADR